MCQQGPVPRTENDKFYQLKYVCMTKTTCSDTPLKGPILVRKSLIRGKHNVSTASYLFVAEILAREEGTVATYEAPGSMAGLRS